MLNTPLLQQNLTTEIKRILDLPFNESSNPEFVKQRFANELAAAIATSIDSWIRQATVTVNAGIPVTTAGSPTAQTGATTAPGTGTIS